jgi:Skp family chaperone for outer membrane proteins
MFATIWRWIKWIVLALLAIAAAIFGIELASKKKKLPVTPAEVATVEHQAQVDTAIANRLEADAKTQEGKIQETATDTGKKLEEIDKRPEESKPGEIAKSDDDFKKTWNE